MIPRRSQGIEEQMMAVLPLIVSLVLAPAVGFFALLAGFDRDRSFYPVQLIAFALLYMLFAAIAGGGTLLLADTPGLLLFGAAAVIGFRTSLWVVAAGLFGHGLFDAVHGALITNPGVPPWWPGFCAGYDITAAGCLAVKIIPSTTLSFSAGTVARGACASTGRAPARFRAGGDRS